MPKTVSDRLGMGQELAAALMVQEGVKPTEKDGPYWFDAGVAAASIGEEQAIAQYGDPDTESYQVAFVVGMRSAASTNPE